MEVQFSRSTVPTSIPIGPTKSLTSMVPAYRNTVTFEAGVGNKLSMGSAKTTEGSGGEFRDPVASVKVSATDAIFKEVAGPKLMPTTENSLLAVHVGHS